MAWDGMGMGVDVGQLLSPGPIVEHLVQQGQALQQHVEDLSQEIQDLRQYMESLSNSQLPVLYSVLPCMIGDRSLLHPCNGSFCFSCLGSDRSLHVCLGGWVGMGGQVSWISSQSSVKCSS